MALLPTVIFFCPCFSLSFRSLLHLPLSHPLPSPPPPSQFINVYDAPYEMAGGYWPHFHARVIAAIVIQQITLFGVFALKGAAMQSILIIPLLLFTVVYHVVFINAPFRANFDKLALEVRWLARDEHRSFHSIPSHV